MASTIFASSATRSSITVRLVNDTSEVLEAQCTGSIGSSSGVTVNKSFILSANSTDWYTLPYNKTLPYWDNDWYHVKITANFYNLSAQHVSMDYTERRLYTYQTINVVADNTGGSPVFASTGTSTITNARAGEYTITANPSSGYEFDYWYPSDNTSARYSLSTSLSAHCRLTYYGGGDITPASRTAKVHYKTAALPDYTLTYDGNGKTGGTVPSAVTKKSGTSITLATNSLIKSSTTGYKVTFNGNGGSDPSALTSNINYSANGWNTKANGTGTHYNNSASYTISANATLYAQWTATNGAITLPTSTRSGYTLNGWYTSSSEGTKLGNAGASYTPTAAITAYAQWTGVSYSVKFNANGGSGTMANQTGFVYGTAKALTANGFTAPTNGGYAFAGWATSEANAKAGTVAYANKANMTTGTTTSGGTVNLYAVWKRTCNFYSGINKATTSSATQYYGGNATLPNLTAISGWTSLGYRDDTTAGTKEFSTGSQVYTGGKDLYAVYNRTLTLSYTNGGGSGNAPSNTTSTQYYNSANNVSTASFTLANNTFTREGYSFSKWAAGKAGAAWTWAPAYNASASTSTAAQWTANEYTVTLNKQSGSGGTNSVTATYGSAMPSATMPTRTGYTFGGYYTSTEGGGTQYYKADGSSAKNWAVASNTTLYAKWTGNNYTVTLDRQNGSGGSSSATATYGSAMPAITVPSRTGYTFGGYYTSTNGGGTQYYNSSGTSSRNWDIAEARTLYAKWTANEYTMTLDGNGGSGGTTSVKITYNTAASNYPAITVPSRTGYTFTGFYTAKTGGTQYYTAAGKGAKTFDVSSNSTWYAQWSENKYNIAYDKNGGTSTPSTQSDNLYTANVTLADSITRDKVEAATYTITYNANGHGTAPSNNTTKKYTTYSFNKWNTKADGTGTAYAAKASVSKLSATNGATVTLYATWTVGSQTDSVTLSTMSTQSSGSGTTAKQWLFDGWYTAATGGTKVTSPYTPTGNVTLYAHWIDDLVTITYNKNESSSSTTTTTETQYRNATGFSIKDATVFTRTGYKLIGWCTNRAGTASAKYLPASTAVTLPATGNLTLYAIWYEIFVWTSNDAVNVIKDKPINTATASKWNELETKIKNYVNSNYSPTPVTTGAKIQLGTTSTYFKKAVNALSGAAVDPSGVKSGDVIKATNFNSSTLKSIKDALNENATYLGAI